MAKIFFPSCQNKIAYPNASEKLREYLISSYGVEKIAGCCRAGNDRRELSSEDTAIVICNTCFGCCEQLSEVGNIISVWEIIDSDYNFPFPNYNDEKITVQDCSSAVGKDNIHNAVRSLLKKMNMEPIQLNENRNKCQFCGGMAAYVQQSVRNADHSSRPARPETRSTGTAGVLEEQSEKGKINFMKEHVKQFTTEKVACYCVKCDAGIKMGGKKSVNLINLLFNEIIY
jgi:hypothetical protein